MDEAYRLELAGGVVGKCPHCDSWTSGPTTAPEIECGDCSAMVTMTDLIGLAEPLSVLDERIQDLAERRGVSLEPGREAVQWAVTKTRFLADGETILSEEADLWVDVEEMDSGGGTMDACIPAKGILIDLKSGMIRSYREQMRTYALGKMRETFADSYKVVILFADQRETETFTFSFEEAESGVKAVRAKALDPNKTLVPNEYCSWCAEFESCPARKELATRVAGHMNVQERWEIIKEDPEELAHFLKGADILTDYVKIGKARLLEFAEAGVELIGFHKRKGKVSETLPAENILAWMKQNPEVSAYDVIRAFGSMTGSKFKAMAKSLGVDSSGVSFVKHEGSPYIQKSPEKKSASDK
jgi:hypothetical protein